MVEADKGADDARSKSVNARIAVFMACWCAASASKWYAPMRNHRLDPVIDLACRYACSGATLFGNKHILATLNCDPNLLAMSQMFSTAFFGALKMYGPRLCGWGKEVAAPHSSQPLRNFMLDMLLVGMMRFLTVVLGLVSLKYVAVSFDVSSGQA